MYTQFVRPPVRAGAPTLRVRSRVQAGRLAANRCQQVAPARSLRIRSRVRAGRLVGNRCEALALG